MLDNINHATVDCVPNNAFGPQEIGFTIPERYNASEILFRNLEAGRDEKIAVYSLQGNTSYGELCFKAARAGNALKALGLCQGDRVLLFLNDTTAYPAVFFGAVRAGFVPMLINTLSPKDLIRFYLQDFGRAGRRRRRRICRHVRRGDRRGNAVALAHRC